MPKSRARSGAVADYIPELTKADPEDFGISIATTDGYIYEVGDSDVPFTIQSIQRPSYSRWPWKRSVRKKSRLSSGSSRAAMSSTRSVCVPTIALSIRWSMPAPSPVRA